MKGIAILVMIIGHSHIPSLMENFLYVWHMPLFFLVSGYFYKQRPETEFYHRNIRQLLIPYCVTAGVLIIFAAIKQYFTGKGDSMITLIAALVGNGCTNNPPFSEYSIGPIWFLLAMFWCRCIYNSLQTRIVAPLTMGGGSICLVCYGNIYRFHIFSADQYFRRCWSFTFLLYWTYGTHL